MVGAYQNALRTRPDAHRRGREGSGPGDATAQGRQQDPVHDARRGVSIGDVEIRLAEGSHACDIEPAFAEMSRQLLSGLEDRPRHTGQVVEVEATLALVGAGGRVPGSR